MKIAIAAEAQTPKEGAQFQAHSFANEPFNSIIGPVKDRGGAAGLISHKGYIVAEWGDPSRVDMTHSVTKTFLTTTVGLAFQRGLIKDVNDYVRDYMPPDIDLFASEHNRKIKWDHLLRQTSDWQGTLWGKPDWADRPVGANAAEWANRKLWEPGTHFKYNDVRVNVLHGERSQHHLHRLGKRCRGRIPLDCRGRDEQRGRKDHRVAEGRDDNDDLIIRRPISHRPLQSENPV